MTRLLTSHLYLPSECDEPGSKVSAVIIQHGSGRLKHAWCRELPAKLNQKGIAALVANRLYDAFAAFRTLQAIDCI